MKACMLMGKINITLMYINEYEIGHHNKNTTNKMFFFLFNFIMTQITTPLTIRLFHVCVSLDLPM